MKKYLLKNPTTGKYWNGDASYEGHRKIKAGLGDQIGCMIYEEGFPHARLTQDLIDIGALVREYLPEERYYVYMRAEYGEEPRYYCQTNLGDFGWYALDAWKRPVAWRNHADIPRWLRGRLTTTDKSAGWIFNCRMEELPNSIEAEDVTFL